MRATADLALTAALPVAKWVEYQTGVPYIEELLDIAFASMLGPMWRGVSVLLLSSLTACDERGVIDEFAFIEGYRISHYLDVAVQLQKLDGPAREAALRELAGNRRRASEIYPLCRMLFEAKENQEFRRPWIGGAAFLGNTAYDDWPLEPITIHQGLPILIVRGYFLAGTPEPPQSYLAYCLKNCKWREGKYAPVDQARRRKIMAEFIEANPRLAGDADWLRPQAE